MTLIEEYHGKYIHSRRVRVLADHLIRLIPADASVLDVGAGDGWLSSIIQERRPDIAITGVDPLVRPDTHIPVEAFDGEHLPFDDNAKDIIVFVDVLHHTEDPMVLLKEATRVARKSILIKDHLCNSRWDEWFLRKMDTVSNRRYGVALPYNYYSSRDWDKAISQLNLTRAVWNQKIGLYPLWARWIFERSLHFVARLDVPS